MLRICTINTGNYCGLGKEYTNILADSVRRNLADTIEGTFTVFTDDPDGYDDGIEVKPLPHAGLSGWWNKLALFKPNVFDGGDRVVFIDLSTLITGRLDDIIAYDGEFAILRDFYRGGDGLQSAFMSWRAGSRYTSEFWKTWLLGGMTEIAGGDQAWIELCCLPDDRKPDIWQDMHHDLFVSYKVSNGVLPQRASVVKFHGEPKPHQILDGWVPRVWKIGGMTQAQLENVCNTENKIIDRNIRHAMTVYAPWFDFDHSRHDGQACIVGGSPSLATQIEQLKWRKAQGHTIFSMNGSMEYLIDRGITPDYHVMLDAREANAEFVRNAPSGIKYLIASQCDKSVFDALVGRDVTIFHNSTQDAEKILSGEKAKAVHLLGGGTTVGMKAMLLAELMGFSAIHLYGMDSCYSDGGHHAYAQGMNDGERVVDVLYGNRDFKCSGWMASQAQDFLDFCVRSLVTITVAGDGLLAHIARCGIPESAADTRAREVLSRLTVGAIGAEIGVFAGELSARLLTRDDIGLYMVDSWTVHGDGQYVESGDFHATLSQTQQDSYMQMAINATAFAEGRRTVLRSDSVSAAAMVDMLDFVFIDADHSYEGCKADIAAWYPKIKSGGLVSGHDYSNTDFPCFGVNQAVDEFTEQYGLTLELGDNFTWFARKP